MQTLLLKIYRAILKLVANLSKICAYPFHWLFPRKRFTLPRQAKPLIATHKSTLIPKTIWQTNYTDRVTLPVYMNYLFNRLMAPTYEYRFMKTEERKVFIEENYPQEIAGAYDRLQIGAAQADFWRVLVLQRFGGVYMDIDAHQVLPLSAILRADMSELFLRIKTGKLSNYFIASKPNNPNLGLVIERIKSNIETNASPNVYDLTGPGVFDQVLSAESVPSRDYFFTCNQGNFTNEYFQYVDKPQGKWTKEQSKTKLLKEL